MRKEFIDLTGDIFGRWLVEERAKNEGGKAQFFCRCSCGMERIVRSADLRNGSSRSCGCLARKIWSRNLRKRRAQERRRKKAKLRAKKVFKVRRAARSETRR